jgi:hypothetical protein
MKLKVTYESRSCLVSRSGAPFPTVSNSVQGAPEPQETNLAEVEMKDFSLSDVRLFTKAAQLGGLTRPPMC